MKLGLSGPYSARAWGGHVPDLMTPIYYFAGPGQMVGAMQDLLRKIGVAQSDMRVEQLFGY